MSKQKKISLVILIFLLSFVLLILYTGFEGEAFLYDDNRTQWFPVTEKAYEQLFEDGSLPSYSFYLGKGLPIAEPGYYDILNPFMFVSYIIAHALPWNTNIMAVYVCLMSALGSVFLFGVCQRLKFDTKTSLLAVAALLTSSTFTAHFYWKYIYNNVFFIPLLIYVFLKFRNTKAEYFACGLVLALDVFCGNVQYTFYHYMVYGIISLIMILARKKNSFKAAVSNVVVGIGLSVPVFILLLNASTDFGGGEFMSSATRLWKYLPNTLFPAGIFKQFGIDPIVPAPVVMSRADGFLCYCAPCILPVIICAVPFARREFKNAKTDGLDKYVRAIPARVREYAKDENKLIVIGVLVSYLVMMNICDRNIIAVILSKVPVVNNFRYLFKALFVAVPLLALLTAVLLSGAKKKLRTVAAWACVVCSLIGVVNNIFVYREVRGFFEAPQQKTIAEEKDYLQEMISENKMDLKNYRSVCMYCHNRITPQMFDYSKGVMRNFPAYVEMFTLSAYEISLGVDVREQFDMIYDPERFLTVYLNGGTIEYLDENLSDFPDETEQQLIANGVKYVIVQRKSDQESLYAQDAAEVALGYEFYTDELAEKLDSLENISVEDVRELNEIYDVIVLSGVNSICTDNDGNSVPISDERMDLISFEASGKESYTVQMAYNEKLYAEYVDASGSITKLDITADETGNTVISAENRSGGRIRLGYSDKVFTMGIVCEITVSALLVLLLAMSFLPDRKKVRKASDIAGDSVKGVDEP